MLSSTVVLFRSTQRYDTGLGRAVSQHFQGPDASLVPSSVSTYLPEKPIWTS